jgi:pilus assembly protein CpaD
MLTASNVQIPAPRRRPVARPVALAMLLAVSAGLAGCASPAPRVTGSITPENYKQRHPIVLAEGAETIDIPVSAAQSSMPVEHQEVIQAFAEEARTHGTHYMTIQVPQGSLNQHAVSRLVGSMRTALARGGIDRGVVVQPYSVHDSQISAPVRMSYPRIKAKVPTKCGQWPEDMGANYENTEYYNFGCAYQSNLAAVIDNPMDFVTPRAEASSDMKRRQTVLEAWRKGQSPATQYPEETRGLADVGN